MANSIKEKFQHKVMEIDLDKIAEMYSEYVGIGCAPKVTFEKYCEIFTNKYSIGERARSFIVT